MDFGSIYPGVDRQQQEIGRNSAPPPASVSVTGAVTGSGALDVVGEPAVWALGIAVLAYLLIYYS